MVVRALLILSLLFQPMLAWGGVRAGVEAAGQRVVAAGEACCPLCDATSPESCGCCCVRTPALPDGPREPRAPAPERANGPLLAQLALPAGLVVWGEGGVPALATAPELALHPIAGDRPQPFLCVWTT